jgi:hypothetical protein
MVQSIEIIAYNKGRHFNDRMDSLIEKLRKNVSGCWVAELLDENEKNGNRVYYL